MFTENIQTFTVYQGKKMLQSVPGSTYLIKQLPSLGPESNKTRIRSGTIDRDSHGVSPQQGEPRARLADSAATAPVLKSDFAEVIVTAKLIIK